MHWRRLRHVHLLGTLPTRLAVAKAVQLIKAGSSAWIHQAFPNLRNFAWQQGYGAFSVGISQVRSITSSSSLNIIGHEPFKKSIQPSLRNTAPHFNEKYLQDQLHPIIPYPTGRLFRGTFSQALRARLRSGLPLRDALAYISQ